MIRRRWPKKIWIPLAIAAGLIAAISGIIYWYNKPLPERLTSSVKAYATHGEIFTESKLIEYHEDGFVNMNGDGTMEGVFQLSKQEVETLLSSDPLLKCPPKKSCPATIKGVDITYYCKSETEEHEIAYILCVDATKNQAKWTFMWL